MLNFDMAKSPGRTYRYYTGTANYPFGWGLSYSNFSISAAPDAKSSVQVVSSSTNATFAITVTNTGAYHADEVVFAFFKPLDLPLSAPASAKALRKQLFFFERISLAPQASQVVICAVSPKSVRLADESGLDKVYPGKYSITIGMLFCCVSMLPNHAFVHLQTLCCRCAKPFGARDHRDRQLIDLHKHLAATCWFMAH